MMSRNVGCFLRLEVYFYSRHLMEPTRIVSGSFEAQSGFYSSVRNSGSHFHWSVSPGLKILRGVAIPWDADWF